MKNCAMLLIGVSLLMSATGCCCGWPCGSACGYGAAYGSCPGGACSPGMAPGGYPAVVPQGAYYIAPGTPQLAAAPSPVFDQQFAAAPMAFPQTAMASGPLDPLPTY